MSDGQDPRHGPYGSRHPLRRNRPPPESDIPQRVAAAIRAIEAQGFENTLPEIAWKFAIVAALEWKPE